MSADLLAGLFGALLTGLIAFAGLRWQVPKWRAESRKLNSEAAMFDWKLMRDEIQRLTETVKVQGQRIAELEQLTEGHFATKRENDRLRQRVKQLENRCGRLESILRIGPLSPEMQKALDKLDQSSRRSGTDQP